MYIRGLIPRNSAELAEEVPIGSVVLYVMLKGYSVGLSRETCSYYSLKLTGKDDILDGAGLVNIECIDFRAQC